MAVDITAMKAAHEDLAHAAFHDALTQLPNRVLLYDRIEQALALARRERQQVAVCYLTWMAGKAVNDAQGHDAGDQLLQTVAALDGGHPPAGHGRAAGRRRVRPGPDLHRGREWRTVLARVIDAIGEPIVLSSGAKVAVGVTAGVAVFSPDDTVGAHELIERADHEMLRGSAMEADG